MGQQHTSSAPPVCNWHALAGPTRRSATTISVSSSRDCREPAAPAAAVRTAVRVLTLRRAKTIAVLLVLRPFEAPLLYGVLAAPLRRSSRLLLSRLLSGLLFVLEGVLILAGSPRGRITTGRGPLTAGRGPLTGFGGAMQLHGPDKPSPIKVDMCQVYCDASTPCSIPLTLN